MSFPDAPAGDRSPGTEPSDPPVVDVLGVGFGPSNLALAIATQEHNATVPPDQRLRAMFVEKQAAFGWHRGMLLDGATMQVSFLKDLVTMRNPTSPLSFLSYLHEQDRLADFINNKSLFPSRVEFHDYLEWAAADVRHLVAYGSCATGMRAVRSSAGGPVQALDVEVSDVASGEVSVVRARNVVLAAGMTPTLPEGVEAGPRVWHNSQLAHRLGAIDRRDAGPATMGENGTNMAPAPTTDDSTTDDSTAGDQAIEDPGPPRPRRFVVVGAGQSAAETAEHLHARYPDSEIRAVFSRYGYSPADDTSFANRIFDPVAVDHFYTAPGEVKQMLMGYHANTNYSVVDPELINELYRRAYQEQVTGQQRLHVHSACRAHDLRVDDDPDADVEVDVEFLPTGERETLRADVVVYATGYRPVDPTSLLGDAAAWCRRDEAGELLVERDYQLTTTSDLAVGVYVQGPTEHTHGISSTLLSTTAVRAGEIVESLAASSGAGAPTSAAPALSVESVDGRLVSERAPRPAAG